MRIEKFLKEDLAKIKSKTENTILSYEEIEKLHIYMSYQINRKAMFHPENTIILLPRTFSFSENSKYKNWREVVSYSKFVNHYNDHFPDNRVIKSYSDNCSTCFILTQKINNTV